MTTPNTLHQEGCTEPNRAACPRRCIDFCNKFETEKAQQEAQAGELPPLPDERKAAEQEYSISAFNYPESPIGSRDWGLYWDGWKSRALLASQPTEKAGPCGNCPRETKYGPGICGRCIEAGMDFEPVQAEPVAWRVQSKSGGYMFAGTPELLQKAIDLGMTAEPLYLHQGIGAEIEQGEMK